MNYLKRPTLLAMMAVRNEANRFTAGFRPAQHLADGIVILDDASTDHTPELCRAHPQ